MKLIEKLLDKYYSNKLKQIVKQELIKWYLDYQFVELNRGIYLEVKKPEYNATQYKLIWSFNKDESLYYVCNYKQLKNDIQDAVDYYYESVK